MVDIYASDEEKAEALKKWWRENGKSVFGGVAIGLAGVFGWQSWMQHQETQKAQASFQYHQLAQAAQAAQEESVSKQQEMLAKEHAGSVYVQFAALELSRVKVEGGDLDGAATLLDQVMQQTRDPSLKQIARLRLARLRLAQDKVDEAAALLAAAPKDAFQGEVDALQGDVAMRQNKPEEARAAYRAAIANGAGNSSLLQLKLDNLGEAADAASAG